ncbi:distant relative of cell wall-associated hydrolase-like protein [Bacillus sp. DJP31]|uniref:distant relative of cell wall-associated hydrolase-like protein n=1 Tax=Bacillus sp. DJP31 TaxID=3409789 RepID=UPI003BB7A938
MQIKRFFASTCCAIMLIGGLEGVASASDNKSEQEKIKIEFEQKITETEAQRLKNEKVNQKEVEKELKWMKKNAPEKYAQIMQSSNPEQGEFSTLASSTSLGTNGDVVITYDAKTSGWSHGHAAVVRWDNSYIIEAWPDAGVRYYTNNWKSRFNDWKGLWISGASGADYDYAQSYGGGQVGDPYSTVYGKYQSDKWNCSLLAWKAWNQRGFDLDADGGIVVTPSDLDRDSQTTTFASN